MAKVKLSRVGNEGEGESFVLEVVYLVSSQLLLTIWAELRQALIINKLFIYFSGGHRFGVGKRTAAANWPTQHLKKASLNLAVPFMKTLLKQVGKLGLERWEAEVGTGVPSQDTHKVAIPGQAGSILHS